MLPIDPLTLGSILTLAAAGATSTCQAPKPTEINVIPSTAPVEYDLSQPLASLQKVQIDTVNPYGYNNITHTKGFMKGLISMQPKVKVDYKVIPSRGTVCLWYETINLEIKIEPLIVIAKEVSEDPCSYKAVREHELKHVNADRKIVNKYSKIMGQKIYDGLKTRGFSVGPIPTEHAQSVVDRMHKTVAQLVELEYKKMEIERTEVQQAIDSHEEYERVRGLCPQTSEHLSGHRGHGRARR